jgi:hypothetical protein
LEANKVAYGNEFMTRAEFQTIAESSEQGRVDSWIDERFTDEGAGVETVG